MVTQIKISWRKIIFFTPDFFSCKGMMILVEPVPLVDLPDAHTQNGAHLVSSTPPHAVSQITILILFHHGQIEICIFRNLTKFRGFIKDLDITFDLPLTGSG